MKKIIYDHGQIYTGRLPLAEAFVVEGDRFLGAGTAEEMKDLAGGEAERIDLEGRFVCAGFNDSHMHLLNYGYILGKARLTEHTSSLEELLRYLREFEQEEDLQEGEWLSGWGWNQDYFRDERRFPTRWDLDRVSTERPICLTRACGHCCVVNSRALSLLGITADTPDPEGGRFEREKGEPNGIIREQAVEYVISRIPKPSLAQLKMMMKKALGRMNAYGITSCQTDDFETFPIPYQQVIQAYQELEESGELTVRIYQQAQLKEEKALEAFWEEGWSTGAGTLFYKMGPLKIMGDGSLGSRTAYLSRPYADDEKVQGITLMSRKKLESLITMAHGRGMQIAIHGIGDGMLDWILEGYEKAAKAEGRTDCRHGVVHCQITRPEQLERIARNDLHVYAQTIFLDYDVRIVEDRVGKRLASTSYAFKTLLKKGVHVSNGSDCPVEEPDVMAGIQCAVTRKRLDGTGDPFGGEEAMTVQEALDSYTSQGAYASFEEKEKGSIQAGMLADFVVLENNPFTAPQGELKGIQVLKTYVGGRCVYQKEKDGEKDKVERSYHERKREE
ncbi:MAG: amidohydrolase family protein [Eubacteriales bacterium]|nr:amidohydrolase family protein [Eubacteriales bacterium]